MSLMNVLYRKLEISNTVRKYYAYYIVVVVDKSEISINLHHVLLVLRRSTWGGGGVVGEITTVDKLFLSFLKIYRLVLFRLTIHVCTPSI